MRAFFQRVDLAAHRQQVAQVAAQLKEKEPAVRACASSPKRSVGRPRHKRPAAEVLKTAANVNTLQLLNHKRGKYTRWLNSPYINDILQAYQQAGGSARRAVAALQAHFLNTFELFQLSQHFQLFSIFQPWAKLFRKRAGTVFRAINFARRAEVGEKLRKLRKLRKVDNFGRPLR